MENISEDIYKLSFMHHPAPMLILDAESYNIIEMNISAERQYQYTRDEFLKMSFADLFVDSDFKKFVQLLPIHQKEFKVHKSIWTNIKKDKEKFFAELYVSEIKYNHSTIKTIALIDVTQHALAELDNKNRNYKYRFLTEESFDAIWDWDLLKDELTWNESAKKMFEIESSDQIDPKGWWTSNLHPDDKERVLEKLNTHLKERIPKWRDEYRFKTALGNYKYISDRGYLVFDEKNVPIRMIGAMQDISGIKSHEMELQNLNNSLERRARELAESNAELERFAYVASHDLQEPLRMISSFLQLLEKKYKEKLDNKAHEYIAYAVDGAERMKKLILDLLEYSRVNTTNLQKEEVDLNNVLANILFTYNNQLAQTNGSISCTVMPVVKGNKTQLLQVFQNLIGNAFKYRSEAPPNIKISSEEENTFYKFSIADNGIGIDPKFYNKIFIIFQRLHTRESYSGTGIGLSICKKIVEKHGGKLWVKSAIGQGSTFYFTLPK